MQPETIGFKWHQVPVYWINRALLLWNWWKNRKNRVRFVWLVSNRELCSEMRKQELLCQHWKRITELPKFSLEYRMECLKKIISILSSLAVEKPKFKADNSKIIPSSNGPTKRRVFPKSINLRKKHRNLVIWKKKERLRKRPKRVRELKRWTWSWGCRSSQFNQRRISRTLHINLPLWTNPQSYWIFLGHQRAK